MASRAARAAAQRRLDHARCSRPVDQRCATTLPARGSAARSHVETWLRPWPNGPTAAQAAPARARPPPT
ncbi:hypothetical protein PJP10_29470 [Mycobacterium kansasii]